MHTGLRDIDPAVVTINGPRHANRRENSCSGAGCEPVAVLVSDWRTRTEVSALLTAQQIEVRVFTSAASCLDSIRAQSPLCLIADFHLPDLSGLEFQRQVGASVNLPIIFVSGPCDTRSVVQAMKSGALELLTKPVDPEGLLSAVHAAFAQQQLARSRKNAGEILDTRYSQLTPREREVFALVAGGLQNKEAASILGIAKITLQIHRSNVMRKMQAGSFAELVRMAVRLRIGTSARDNQRASHYPATPRSLNARAERLGASRTMGSLASRIH
jgi:FixJ family two-component response regulator